MEFFACGAVAALLTIFDIAKTFYIPRVRKHKFTFFGWAASFVLVNALLAALMYTVLKDVSVFHSLNTYFRAVIVGGSYLIIVRAKLATLKAQNEEVPLGIEYFYNSARDFVYRNMNRVSVTSLIEEAQNLASQKTLKELASTVSGFITNSSLSTEQEKTARKSWLLKTLNDSISDEEKTRYSGNVFPFGEDVAES